MAGQDAPTAIVLSAVRRCRSRRRLRSPRSGAPAALDRFPLMRCATWPGARQRPLLDAEIVCGEVSWCSLPGLRNIAAPIERRHAIRIDAELRLIYMRADRIVR